MTLNISDENRRWWILIAMGVAGGLIMLDESVVGIALPTVRQNLGMSDVASHWVMSAYLLAFTGFAAAGGKLGDLFGLKTVMICSLAAFGLASLASGLAETGGWLIAARAVQGLGAAVIFPTSLAMITTVCPPEQRGKAIGIVAGMAMAFLVAGPLVGGVFTELVSWRWIFWINVPIVAVTGLIVVAAWSGSPNEDTRAPIDARGLITLVAGLGLLVFGIMQGADWGWTTPAILASLAGGIVTLGLFVWIERGQDHSLIDVDLFKIPTFSGCNCLLFTGQFSKMTVVVFVALYLQRALGMSPIIAGTALLVAVVGTPLAAGPAGRLADRLGARRPALGGMAVAAAAMLWVGLAAGWDSYLWLAPALILWGFALPISYIPPLRAIANAVPAAKQGQASGIGMTSRLLGGTFGVAVGSTVYQTTGDFQIVFLATAGIMLLALLVGWLTVERNGPHQAPQV